MDDSRDNKKNRFSNTMAFMEEYLNNVLNDELPFHNEEKNKLTYEVGAPRRLIGLRSPSSALHSSPMITSFASAFFLQVVSLARHLIYFGFYSFFELLRLTRTLLGIIDCRPNPGYAAVSFHEDGSGTLCSGYVRQNKAFEHCSMMSHHIG